MKLKQAKIDKALLIKQEKERAEFAKTATFKPIMLSKSYKNSKSPASGKSTNSKGRTIKQFVED